MARTTRSAVRKPTAAASQVKVEDEPTQLSSPPPTPAPPKRAAAQSRASRKKAGADEPSQKLEQSIASLQAPETARKRKRVVPKSEHDDELPHNMGPAPSTADIATVKKSPKKKTTRTLKDELPISPETLSSVETIISKTAATPSAPEASPAKRAKTVKTNKYGLTPGQTPFPSWPHPTPSECAEVTRLLSAVHGTIKTPKSIPLPSLTTSGCGEVPSVLDALIRTRLSAATSGTNSSRAFQGLVDRFGILKSGIGKGSVDWDAVRHADVADVFAAIKSGGLADVKSRDIKAILQMVYEENQARRRALTHSSSAKNEDLPAGAQHEPPAEKKAEVARTDDGVLSLDHLHLLSSGEAFDALIKYPGIGPKTASCVLLFCLQRPSFAVDTHVFRLAAWLRWVPPGGKTTRNSTYNHLDVRIPDELKYPLHQLLIRHGKSCPRCRAATGEASKGWEGGCPIEHLVKRTGARKGGVGGATAKSKAKGAGKKRKKIEDDDDDESSELSEVDMVDEGLEDESEGVGPSEELDGR